MKKKNNIKWTIIKTWRNIEARTPSEAIAATKILGHDKLEVIKTKNGHTHYTGTKNDEQQTDIR